MDVEQCIEFYRSLMESLFPERKEGWLARSFEYYQSHNGRAWFKAQILEVRMKEVIRETLGSDQENAFFETEAAKCNV
jgi:hypothetical protein